MIARRKGRVAVFNAEGGYHNYKVADAARVEKLANLLG